jgi:hypothetical protein
MTQHKEALRQQMLLRAIWRDAAPGTLKGWARPAARADVDRGLQAYQANAGALAARALASAFPTIAELVGEESFGALARDFWHHHGPERGDIGEWGAALPAFIAASPQLASEPYLADSARLDWQVHGASRAADAAESAPDLDVLARADPVRIQLRLAPGAACIDSRWPVVSIWQAHQARAEDRFATVRAAFQAQHGEHAFVWRAGFHVQVERIDDATLAFMRALLDQRSLADALDLSGSGFAFDQWLVRALPARWIAAIHDNTENAP